MDDHMPHLHTRNEYVQVHLKRRRPTTSTLAQFGNVKICARRIEFLSFLLFRFDDDAQREKERTKKKHATVCQRQPIIIFVCLSLLSFSGAGAWAIGFSAQNTSYRADRNVVAFDAIYLSIQSIAVLYGLVPLPWCFACMRAIVWHVCGPMLLSTTAGAEIRLSALTHCSLTAISS